MNPGLIALILQLVEEAIKDAPGVIADLRAIFSKDNPTPTDWQALRIKVLSQSYADFVPASALVAAPPASAAPAAPEPAASPVTVQPAAQAPIPARGSASGGPEPYLADGTRNPAHAG